MKRTPTLLSTLLCGAMLVSLPVWAAGTGGTAGGGIGAGPTTGAAGTSTGTGVNTTGQVTTPAGAVNKNSAANANAAVAAGPSTSTGGLSNSGGDINNATAGNNAGSVDMSTQTPAKGMSRKAQANASAAGEQTTRQLNRQQAQLNEQSSAGRAANPKAPVQ